MIDKELHISNLIFAELNQTLTDAERIELEAWINASADNLAFYRQFTDQQYFQHELKMFQAVDTDHIWELTKSGLVKDETSEITLVPVKRIKLWPRFAIAAAIATIVFGAGLFYYYGNVNRGPVVVSVNKNDVAPGKYGAILTLADGKEINLTNSDNGELAKEAGISINKTADGQVVYQVEASSQEKAKRSYNTLTTAKGETYILTLPDKSKVWMNAASSLTYSTSLNKEGNREVRLSGEAYFEVTKDKRHPFIVKTDRQEVKVLGTHFNINSYKDEPETITTLLEGSVRINGSKILKPGEQANLDKKGKLVVSPGNSDVIAWKEGRFSFKDTELAAVLRQLSRWYNVEVKYPDGIPNMKFTGYIDRSYTLSEALRILKYLNINFKITDRTIVVSK
ncbi:FecR protein [Pedobacter steynii]|uniref:FecR protein n=1 Tax=Pedobacter steynii TaxID=430522 RepID=A0A1G9PCG7_9SPHI|nr:FecR family protein [Pedobacter steynii]NQX39038.1 FecR domain-containing protein [Pedobacter steynii]SDL95917.1 FecR protein [Pedobacter steynii]